MNILEFEASAHRAATRRTRRVTGRFAPSSVLPFTYLTFPAYFPAYSVKTSVGIDLTELGGQMSKCLKFCPGIKI